MPETFEIDYSDNLFSIHYRDEDPDTPLRCLGVYTLQELMKLSVATAKAIGAAFPDTMPGSTVHVRDVLAEEAPVSGSSSSPDASSSPGSSDSADSSAQSGSIVQPGSIAVTGSPADATDLIGIARAVLMPLQR